MMIFEMLMVADGCQEAGDTRSQVVHIIVGKACKSWAQKAHQAVIRDATVECKALEANEDVR